MLGNQMFFADHFSKATIAEEKQDENHDKVFTGELEKLNPFMLATCCLRGHFN